MSATATQQEHAVTFSRFSRGRSAVGNRPLYGYTLRCACGWTQRVNGPMREAEQTAKAHARAPNP